MPRDLACCSARHWSLTRSSYAQVLVDGVANDVPRQVLSIKRVALTDFVLPITRGARSKQLKKVVAKEGIVAKWEATSWAKKLAVREARLNTTDFDRHQIAIAKRQVRLLAPRLPPHQYLYLSNMMTLACLLACLSSSSIASTEGLPGPPNGQVAQGCQVKRPDMLRNKYDQSMLHPAHHHPPPIDSRKTKTALSMCSGHTRRVTADTDNTSTTALYV